MTDITKIADRGLDRVIDALAVIAAVLICALAIMICIDVVGRKPGWYTLPWTYEFAEYALYLVTFFGAPWVLRSGDHIAIDLIVQQLRPKARRRAALATHLTGAVVCGLLTYFACRVWWTSFRENVNIHATLVFPEWILLSVAPPAFLIMFALFVRFIIRPPERHRAAESSDGL